MGRNDQLLVGQGFIEREKSEHEGRSKDGGGDGNLENKRKEINEVIEEETGGFHCNVVITQGEKKKKITDCEE